MRERHLRPSKTLDSLYNEAMGPVPVMGVCPGHQRDMDTVRAGGRLAAADDASVLSSWLFRELKVMSKPSAARPGVIVLFIGTIMSLVAALYGYFAPLTGVNATLGALLTIVISVVLIVFGLALARAGSRGARVAWRCVILVGLVGNAFAGALLHEWWLCLGMLMGAVGLVIDCFGSAGAEGRV